MQSVLMAVKKSICSGKQGEAALKFHSDGSVLSPVDTVADVLKIVEDAIQGSPAFKIGVSFQADLLWVEAAKKYELENPKAPLDTEQMIDYIVKLCADKPSIAYLEDPLVSTGPPEDWQKLKEKLPAGVMLGSRKVLETPEKVQEMLKAQGEMEEGSDCVDFCSVLDYAVVTMSQFHSASQLMNYLDLSQKLKSKVTVLVQEQSLSGGYPYIADYNNLGFVEVCLNPPFRPS